MAGKAEVVFAEFEPILALYKAIELRQLAGIKTHLDRNLSFVANEQSKPPLRKKQKAQPASRTKSDQIRKKRSNIIQKFTTEVKSLGYGNLFVLRILGIEPNAIKSKYSKLQVPFLCAYVCLFAKAELTQNRLLECYEVAVPILKPGESNNSREDDAVEIAFQYDFALRKRFESLYLVVYTFEASKEGIKRLQTQAVRQVIRSEGPLHESCNACLAMREQYRKQAEFLYGLEDVNPLLPPHLQLGFNKGSRPDCIINTPESAVLGFYEVRIWGMENGTRQENEMSLDASSRGFGSSNSRMLLDLQWERNIATPLPSLGPCCDILRTSPSPIRRCLRPAKPILVGLRSHEQLLPLTIRWKTKMCFVEEVLREYRCPLCWMFTGSWDGLHCHLNASHEKIEWDRKHDLLIEARMLPLVLTSQVDENNEEDTVEEKTEAIVSWFNRSSSAPKRMKFIDTSRAFEASFVPVDLIENVDDSWMNEQDSKVLAETDDMSDEEKALMLAWNAFSRENMLERNERLSLQVLDSFVDKNLGLLAEQKLFPNLILLFTMLYDFGLVSANDVLNASVRARKSVAEYLSKNNT